MSIFKNGIPIIPVLAILLFLSWLTVVYSQGYRLELEKKKVKVTQTGILSVRSIPEGATVYLNGKIETATNSTVSSLSRGTYKVEIKKDGFTDWDKTVEVYNDKVTDITALLISKSPRIEPLTNYGVSSFAIFHDGSKIIYSTKNGKEPGIWLLPLNQTASLSIFGGNKNLVLADTKDALYSFAEEILISPQDDQILIRLPKNEYHLISISDMKNQSSATKIVDPTPVFENWREEKKKILEKYIEKLDIREDLREIASNPDSVWSPDFKKFLLKNNTPDGKIQYKIYNFENPLPVGEEMEYMPLTVKKDEEISVCWYSDSYHLIVQEDQTVEIVRVDGSNRTEIFTGSLAKKDAFPTPSGDKIIILASFKQSVPPDLYTVSIR
jgi:hypothetical protein